MTLVLDFLFLFWETQFDHIRGPFPGLALELPLFHNLFTRLTTLTFVTAEDTYCIIVTPSAPCVVLVHSTILARPLGDLERRLLVAVLSVPFAMMLLLHPLTIGPIPLHCHSSPP